MEMDETFKKLLSTSSLYFKDLLCIIISAIIFGSPEACQIPHSVLILDLNSGLMASAKLKVVFGGSTAWKVASKLLGFILWTSRILVDATFNAGPTLASL